MTKKSSSVTIRDVAQRANVSVATVSRYLNRNAPISAEVAERLKKVMDELNYVPHATARHLATRKTRTIGVLLTNMHNDFFAPLLSGIESVVTEQGYNLLVATFRPGLREQYQPPVGMHNTDGLLIFADSLSDQQILLLQSKQFPVVLVHRTPPADAAIPSVTVENKAASRKLVDHLIEVHQRRRILFLRGPANQEDSYWREVGYRTSLESHGIPVDESLILVGGFEREIAYQILKPILQAPGPLPFDAIFAGDDDAAIGVLQVLRDHGVRVPDEISVVGFDDLPLTSFLSPPLTTVRAPTMEVGYVAAKQLFEIINNDADQSQVTLLPTELVFRRSCGCDYVPEIR